MTDQGQRPTCLSIALTSTHEQAIGDRLSAEYLHWASAHHRGGRGTLSAAGHVLESKGQPPYAQWPYRTETDDADPGYGPGHQVVGPFLRRRASRLLTTLDEVVEELRDGRWSLLALRVTDAFAAPGADIVLPDGRGRAGHAVVAVGVAVVRGDTYAPDLRAGDRLFCLRNSWGTSWGANGHKLVSEAALTECLVYSVALDDCGS